MEIKRELSDILAGMAGSDGYGAILLTGIRGAGKSYLLKNFAGHFAESATFDLSTARDRELFDSPVPTGSIMAGIWPGIEASGTRRCIVLREIQQSTGAISRIAEIRSTGSAITLAASASWMTPELQAAIDGKEAGIRAVWVPPLTFEEFLRATGDARLVALYHEVPVPLEAYRPLLQVFHRYSLVGGLPEIAARFLESNTVGSLDEIYERHALLVAEDIRRSTHTEKSRELLHAILADAPLFAATRIKFNHFGSSGRGSRDIAKAFRRLENHFLLRLLHPVTSTMAGAPADPTRSPRLLMTDTGLVNFASGIQRDLMASGDMTHIFEGQIARQVVGQEIHAFLNLEILKAGVNGTSASGLASSPSFWIRRKPQSSAEVDFVIPHDDLLIPIMVKSGEPGTLRSVHQFVQEASHPYIVRLSAEPLTVRQALTTGGKKFYMLNLPYFLSGKIRDHLRGFIRLISN